MREIFCALMIEYWAKKIARGFPCSAVLGENAMAEEGTEVLLAGS